MVSSRLREKEFYLFRHLVNRELEDPRSVHRALLVGTHASIGVSLLDQGCRRAWMSVAAGLDNDVTAAASV